MKTRKIRLLAIALLMAMTATAQNPTETQLPVVNWGLKTQANASNILLKGLPNEVHTEMAFGGELGGFLNFNISQRFFIQFNLMYFAEQTQMVSTTQNTPLWTLGIEVPVYALARFGSVERGWFYLGGGPYTEFSLWATMDDGSGDTLNPYKHVVGIDDETGEEQLAMTDSHSGLGVLLGYELPCGLQFNASGQYSISDILAFAHPNTMSAHPLKVMLGFGWRF
ncbi:MAG: outer membrane beta-barrel protein [Bacteroidales bacterium]|nr:outer membrane beta-barrel protein [Bacteroidales bacterium]